MARRALLSRFALCLLSLAGVGALVGADQKVDDNLLYDQVNRALITDRDLGSRQLTVAVRDGKVTVKGFVGSDKQHKKIDKVVKKVKGVVSVDNQVAVRPDLR